jgi:isocitrate dehydrogenase
VSYPEVIQAYVREQIRRNDDAIEAMCERMLVTPGDYGVLVVDNPDGTVTASLSHDVPAMTIGYMRR